MARVKFSHPNEFADELKLRRDDVQDSIVRVTIERRRVPASIAMQVPEGTRAIELIGTAVVKGQLFRLDVLIGVVVDIDAPSVKDKDVIGRAQMALNNLVGRLQADGFAVGGGKFEV